MKRCPQCLFIYPDSDARCDFDNTPLVVVDEAELEAATSPTPTPTKRKRTSRKKPASPKPNGATKKRQRKVTAITAIVGLLLGISTFVVYYRFTHRTPYTAQLQATPILSAQPIAAPINTPPVLETVSPSPTATPPPIPKPNSDRVATAHTSTTIAPISTSGPGMGKKPGGKPTILLTSGGKIDADEVWRTRDGVWYRRDGIVTLLKRGRVKAIVNQ
jgi:hypothetical protein